MKKLKLFFVFVFCILGCGDLDTNKGGSNKPFSSESLSMNTNNLKYGVNKGIVDLSVSNNIAVMSREICDRLDKQNQELKRIADSLEKK